MTGSEGKMIRKRGEQWGEVWEEWLRREGGIFLVSDCRRGMALLLVTGGLEALTEAVSEGSSE